jgi:uncharacterized protein YciI
MERSFSELAKYCQAGFFAALPLDLTAIDFEPPPGMRFCYVAFLRRGPAWSAEDSEANRKLGDGHMANIQRLAAEGTLVLAGPFVDSEGAGDLAGIFVLAVDSLAAARAAIESDPAVKAGRFTVELRAWLAGDQIRTAQSPLPPAATKPGERSTEQPTSGRGR